MTHCCDEITRRILNFPAIRPCEFISFPTLLNSLIELCRSICDEYSEKTFLVNRRNSRSCIRLVKNLLVILVEIPDVVSVFQSSITLSLSELHFILQKVRFLLEDCAREDARIWVLMNSRAIADELRVLIRGMTAALDVLDLDGLGVSDDVKELVEFVKIQGLRLKFEAEVLDEMTLREVYLMMTRFEVGVDPGLSELRRVFEYLGIGSWGECNREIRFLEEEIRLELGTEKRKNLKVLSSVLGLMIYSRSVLFPVVERMMNCFGADNFGNGSDGGSSEFVRALNADDFRCPISLELMSDPVVIATGQTYERSSILKWFRAGNPTCPKTGEKVITTDLVPNSALQKLVRQFCSEKNIPFALPDSPGRTRNDAVKMVVPGSLAAEQAVKLLSRFLVGKLGSLLIHEQSRAAYEIRLLTKTSVFNRSCLVESGAIPPLLNLLFSSDPLMQENAVASLLNLSKFQGSRKVIVESGGLILILDVLKEGLKMEARNHAAGTLFYLASDEEYRMLIGEIPEAIPALIDLLRHGVERGKKNALVAIFGLLSSHENHHKVLAAGLVPLLIHLLRSLEKEDLRTDSLAVLATVAEKPDGTNAILSFGALPVIVEVLVSPATSMAARECCVSILLALSVQRRDDVVPVLAKNPSLMGTLYSQISQGSSRTGKKASSLIKILQNYSEKSPFGGFSNSANSHERFVHAWQYRDHSFLIL